MRKKSFHGKTCTPEYRAWATMIQRCYNPKHRHFDAYGGRGIKVCVRWRNPAMFLQDMGERPSPKHTLDRRNNSLGYSPANCRWALRVDQQRNKRDTHSLWFEGVQKPRITWAEEFGIPHETLRARLRLGWTLEAALRTPVNVKMRPKRFDRSRSAGVPLESRT